MNVSVLHLVFEPALSKRQPVPIFGLCRTLYRDAGFTVSMEMLFGRAAIHEGDWLILPLIGVLGFLVWSVRLGILSLYGR
jgi:hypothetical protein